MEGLISNEDVFVLSVDYDRLKAKPSYSSMLTPFPGIILLVVWIILLVSRNDGLSLASLQASDPNEYERVWRDFPKRWALSNGIAFLAVTGLVILNWKQVSNLSVPTQTEPLIMMAVILSLVSANVIAAMQWIGLGPHSDIRGLWAGLTTIGYAVFPVLSGALILFLAVYLVTSDESTGIIFMVFFQIIIPAVVMLALGIVGFFCGILQAISLKSDANTARRWWFGNARFLALSVLLFPVWGFLFGWLSSGTLRALIFPGEPTTLKPKSPK